MSVCLTFSGLTSRIWRRSLITFTMKPIVPRDWTKMEVCIPYPPMTPKKATCSQSVSEWTSSDKVRIKTSAMKLIDESIEYYNYCHDGIAACFGKHFFWFQTSPTRLLHFLSHTIPTNTYQTPLGSFQSHSYEYLDDSPTQRLSAIIKLTFYLLPMPCHLSLSG